MIESTNNPARIVALLTSQRLQSYIDSTSDQAAALALYQWNSEVARELFGILGHTEVILRNAIDGSLRQWARSIEIDDWMDANDILRSRERNDIAMAIRRRQSAERGFSHDDVVSELSFGFWRYLLSAKYEATLWTPAIRFAFPEMVGSPKQLRKASVRLHVLRNRIAHHEPIFARYLDRDRQDCLRLLSWIDPSAKAWVMSITKSSVAVLNARPSSVARANTAG